MSSSSPDASTVLWQFFGAIAAALLIFFIFIRPVLDESAAERAAEHEKEMKELDKQLATEADSRKRREEGLKALEAADDAIRQEAIERRKRLETSSTTVRTTNTGGVRVDQYFLKRGGVISCTTTISGNSPALFHCDGDV